MIQTVNLSKSYGGKNVLNSISVDLRPGTVYGLIGPNGSGKSTFLKCLTGIFSADEGTVTVEEMPAYDNPDAKSRIAYTDDAPAYNQFYSVRQQAKYYGAFYDDFSFESFEKIAEAFELKMKSNANTMSLGQRKKLSVALALARSPKYLIMDEPENGLDNESRRLFREYLREAADNGACILIASHDLANIEDMCDEILFLNKGTLIYRDTIDSLFENVSKWTVKSDKKAYENAVVAQADGDIQTVIVWGDAETGRQLLEKAGAEILSNGTVTLSDAYLICKEVNGNEEKQ